MKRLAIVTTHPIQYNAPWFKLLQESAKIEPKVFYTWGQVETAQKYDPGFGKDIKWDIPLLEGYQYTFVENISSNPGSHHRKGIINPSLNKEIELWQADAVLVFGWAFESHFKCIRYFHNKIPVLFRGDSTLLDERPGIRTLLRRIFLKWVYSKIDIALYVGENNKRYFLENGLKSNQLAFAPHAIDNDRFANPNELYQQQATVLRKQLGIEPQDIVLLFVGKMEQKKNPFFLVELLKRHGSPRLKVLFVGNGVLEPALKKAATNDKRIILLDFQNQQQMPVIYRTADLVVLPSTGPGETWGMVLNEAMASGKAIASSPKAGGTLDLIEERNGVVINFDDTTMFDGLIEKASQNSFVLQQMGQQSLVKIKQYSFQRIVHAVESVVICLKLTK